MKVAVLYLRLYALSKQARLTKFFLIGNYIVRMNSAPMDVRSLRVNQVVGVICVVGIGLFLPSETCEMVLSVLHLFTAHSYH